jgi:large subunit ribosomal protein L10Ae
VKLPHIPRPNLRICVIGDAAHLEEAKKIPKIETMDVEGLKNFNKVKKDVKKWAKKYQVLLATGTEIITASKSN